MRLGTTKDQSLYNKPSVAVHPGALDAGTLPQYLNSSLIPSHILNHTHIPVLTFVLRCAHSRPVLRRRSNYLVDSMPPVLATVYACTI